MSLGPLGKPVTISPLAPVPASGFWAPYSFSGVGLKGLGFSRVFALHPNGTSPQKVGCDRSK